MAAALLPPRTATETNLVNCEVRCPREEPPSGAPGFSGPSPVSSRATDPPPLPGLRGPGVRGPRVPLTTVPGAGQPTGSGALARGTKEADGSWAGWWHHPCGRATQTSRVASPARIGRRHGENRLGPGDGPAGSQLSRQNSGKPSAVSPCTAPASGTARGLDGRHQPPAPWGQVSGCPHPPGLSLPTRSPGVGSCLTRGEHL